MRGMDSEGSQNYFPLVEVAKTKRHRFKVRMSFKGALSRKFFILFFKRAIDIWNTLPEEIDK